MKLLGYSKGTSKKNGNPFCMIHVVSNFSPAELANGSQGEKVDTLFMPQHQVDILKPSDIGKEIFLDYNISNGRAFLNNVSVK